MNQKLTISYFMCNSKKGVELFQQAKGKLEQLGIQGHDVEIILRENDPLVAIEAYLCDDAIIFDGSLMDEADGSESSIGQQYDAMLEPMKASDHVLIVSRSEVPFNVLCTRKGGYPKYIQTGVAEYKESFDNDEILGWLIKTLEDNDLELPNPYKIERESFQKLSDKDKTNVLCQRIEKDVDQSETRRRKSEQVFISYLSRYSMRYKGRNQENAGYTVEDLIAYISQTQGIPRDQIGYFPPGNLSRELMSVQRRWEVVSLTYDFICGCKQFWIMVTPGYQDSWWTLSERFSLSYFLRNDPDKCPDIYVARFDAQSSRFKVQVYSDIEEKKKILPVLDETVYREMARYFANSRPDGVGYESVPPMRVFRHLPLPVLRALSGKIYQMAEEFTPLKNSIMTDMSKEEFVIQSCKSFKSYVYSKSFWEDWVMECPYCRKQSNGAYSIKTFMQPAKAKFCHVVHNKDISFNSKTKQFSYICPSCRHKYFFNAGAYYRWYPMRGNSIHTAPGGKSIEKKAAFFFVEERIK